MSLCCSFEPRILTILGIKTPLYRTCTWQIAKNQKSHVPFIVNVCLTTWHIAKKAKSHAFFSSFLEIPLKLCMAKPEKSIMPCTHDRSKAKSYMTNRNKRKKPCSLLNINNLLYVAKGEKSDLSCNFFK